MRIIGLAGYSGSGKTTLLSKAIPRLIARGVTVSTLKHAHHEFDLDQPGKDSHTHRMAGATEVLVASSRRFALVHELRGEAEPPLASLLGKLAPVDLVLIEGYKREPHPKLEVHRAAVGTPLLMSSLFSLFARPATPWYFPGAPFLLASALAVTGAIVVAARTHQARTSSPNGRPEA